MDNVSMIAAVGRNNELGRDNDLIWKLPGDLKFFREITMGKDIVMGSNTFYSLPKLLPGRKHIVLSSKDIDNNNILVIHTKEELLEYLKELKKEVMIIGGASIYSQMLNYADKLYLTHIDAICNDATVFFPSVDFSNWDNHILGVNSDCGISYKHVLYKRKE